MEGKLGFREILQILKKRYWILLITILLSLVFSWILSFYVIEPMYKSNVTIVLVRNEKIQEEQSITSDSFTANEKLAIAYSNIIKSRSVLNKVILKLNLNYTYEELYKNIEVAPVDETQILKISVLDKDAEQAKDTANAILDIFKGEAIKLTNASEIRIIDEAVSSNKPVKPNKLLNMILGVIVGFTFGLTIVFLLEYLNTKIKNKEDVEKYLGISVIGEIPKYKNRN